MNAARTFGLVFDLDGTLVDSTSEIHQAVSMTLQEWNLPPCDAEEISGLIGQPPAEFFRRSISRSELDRAVHSFRVNLENVLGSESTLFEGTLDLLNECKGQGIPLGIASNKSNRLAQLVAEKMGIDTCFGVIVGTDGIPSKPSPDVVLKAMNSLSLKNGLMIGDTSADITAGRAAGLRTIGITHGPGKGVGLSDADYVVPDMRSLLELLRSEEVTI